MRLIIVEDEARALRGLQHLIESIDEKYEVIASAKDARKALELIVSLKPEVVFTDIEMPYMNGIELIEAVREYGLNIQFVIITAYAEFEYAKKAISLDAVEYLLKPVTYEEMEEVLKKLEANMHHKRCPTKITEKVSKQYPDAHYMIRRAICMIESSFATKLSQEEIANQLGMTQEYFSYLFHKETGTKFSDYIRNYRIQIARSLLEENDMKIHEVAIAVGYSDTKYFSKIFRKVEGITPLEFLKGIKKQ